MTKEEIFESLLNSKKVFLVGAISNSESTYFAPSNFEITIFAHRVTRKDGLAVSRHKVDEIRRRHPIGETGAQMILLLEVRARRSMRSVVWNFRRYTIQKHVVDLRISRPSRA